MSRIEIDVNILQARFDIDGEGNLSQTEPVQVAKSSHPSEVILPEIFAGQPVIGSLAVELDIVRTLERTEELVGQGDLASVRAARMEVGRLIRLVDDTYLVNPKK